MSLIDPTRKEIMAEQKEYLKGKSFKYKLQYFSEYYLKETLIIIAAIVIVFLAVRTAVTHKDNAVQVFLVNSVNAPKPELFAEFAGIDINDKDVVFDNSYYINVDDDGSRNGESSYVSIQKISAIVAARDADVMMGDYETLSRFVEGGFIGDLRYYFTEEELNALGDKVLWEPIYDDDGNPTEDKLPVFIIISGSPIVEECLFKSVDKTVFGVIVNTQRPTMAHKVYEFMTQE